jgi:hypothetical protein
MVIYDLKQAARRLAPEALAIIENAMRHSEDERVRVMAAQIVLERAYGKPRGASRCRRCPQVCAGA